VELGVVVMGMVIVLSIGAVLAVAMCDAFTRQGKLLRILLVVGLPGVGALIATYLVVNARGVAAPSPPFQLPPTEDIASAAVKDLIHHSVNHDV